MLIVYVAAVAFAVLLVRAFNRIKLLEQAVAELEAREFASSPSTLPAVTSEPTVEAETLRQEMRASARIVRSAPTILTESEPDTPLPLEFEPEPAQPLDESDHLTGPALSRNLAASFEDVFGGKLPIWIGGIALILSAFFLVRYSIESGLLGPGVRSTFAALFGLALLGGGEAARRHRATAADPRIGQALTGAGIASLYGTLYMAAELYGLIGALPAFILMVGITVGALALSLRHGPPTAVMGLVGGFVAPLVTGLDATNVAPLLVYLALFTAGLFALAIHRGWMWLALAATGGGLVWPLILMATADHGEIPFVGMFILILAFGATLALPRAGTTHPIIRLAPLVAGLVQLVLLASQLQFSLLSWGLYALLCAAAIWLGWRDHRLSAGAGAALGLAMALLATALVGGDTAHAPFAAIGFTLLFGGAGHALLRRDPDHRTWTAIALGGTGVPLLLVNIIQPDLLRPIQWALIAALLALACSWASWRCRDRACTEPSFDLGFTGGAAAAALLLGVGLAQPLPVLWLASLFLGIAVALAYWARRTRDGGVAHLSLVPLLFGGLVWAGATDPLGVYFDSVFAAGAMPSLESLAAIALIPAMLLGTQAWLLGQHRARSALHWAAWALALSLAPAIVPAPWHAPVLALVAAAACVTPQRRLIPLHGEVLAIAATQLAMLPQLADMANLLILSLTGDVAPYAHLPVLTALLREIGIPGAIFAAILWLRPTSISEKHRPVLGIIIGIALMAVVYALAKQPLAIATPERFVAIGFLERAMLTQLLFVAGYGTLIRVPRLATVGWLLVGLAMFRLVWFDLLLLNPVFVAQAVGPWPILNLAVGHAALAALWLWLLGRREEKVARFLAFASLAITAGALAVAIRQGVHGTLLTAQQITTTENYLYSAGLLILALIWLWRGISKDMGPLRVVGLALLTLVTFKVFLVDAAALEGVLRILSFMGLGLALILIGWAYGRFLRREPA